MSLRPSFLSLPLAIAWRYLRGHRSRLLHRTALAALLSVALGVLAMVIAMALMTGYRRDLEEKLVRGNAAILIHPLVIELQAGPAEPPSALAETPGVTSVRRVAYGQGTIVSSQRPDGEAVTLRGVGAGVDQMGGVELSPSVSEEGVEEAALGLELAKQLQVTEGDLVQLVVLGFRDGRPRFGYQSVRVVSLFRTGFAEFDRHWAVLSRPVVEGLVGGSATGLWELEVDDPRRAPKIADIVRRRLGADYLVTDWQDLNRELFSALRLQQLALFFLLGLIVLVSTFNVASTLMVLVRERLRDVGVLAVLGLDRRRVATVFLVYGGVIGLVGTLIGTIAGATVSILLSHYEVIRFEPEVAEFYFISSVPFRVTWTDLLAIVAFALLFTLASSCIPAWRAARVRAADALRYE